MPSFTCLRYSYTSDVLSFASIHLIIVVHNGPATIKTRLSFTQIWNALKHFSSHLSLYDLYSYDCHCTPSIKHALFINCIDTQSTWYFWWVEASNALILPAVERHLFNEPLSSSSSSALQKLIKWRFGFPCMWFISAAKQSKINELIKYTCSKIGGNRIKSFKENFLECKRCKRQAVDKHRPMVWFCRAVIELYL